MKQNIEKIAVLTSEKSWIIPYCKILIEQLTNNKYQSELFFNHKKIDNNFDVVFILGYTRIIEKEYLKRHKYNLVVHESNLPEGKGWAPYFWQVIKGKNRIPIVLFEAEAGVDSGKIYLKDFIELNGTELYDELRKKQGEKTVELCLKFIKYINEITPKEQSGKESYYRKRTPEDSELNINKTIAEQFNLLRTVNNKEFPAFFYFKGIKYILKIEKDEPEK